MESYVDILMPPELLEPLWKDIDALEARGCYKEAYQYLRTVTNELNQLREARISVCCLLESSAETWRSFQTLQSLMGQHLTPVREHSPLMYLESLRSIMQTVHQALLYKSNFSELQVLVIELCNAHSDRLENNLELPEIHKTTLSRVTAPASNLH